MIPFETIRKIMKEQSNGKQISDKAIVIMSIHVEDYIKNLTKISYDVLDEKNKNRDNQKMRKQKRLCEKCVQKGITIINHENHSHVSEEQIGGKEKTQKYENKKLENWRNMTEVI